MPIEKIRIKNFRSLKDITIEAKALTVFVGGNDEGKSNLLRALDLFFNHDRPDGYRLNWQHDFCALTTTPRGKSPQIEIQITFQLPASYNLPQKVEWVRKWRQKGFHAEEIRLADGKELPSKSKAYPFLKSIRYEYVPAIKGPEYFERLLANIHDMLDATVRTEIRSAAESFTSEIRKHTTKILADLHDQLGLKSDIELPTDLRRLFSELEFRSDAGSHRVALSQRGDGVKARHIPVILTWLANQANHLSAKGRPSVVTIWGYEEPENNLEIRRCFELAEYFVKNSNAIQTFLTTHSPVYYSVFSHVADNINVGIAEVQLLEETGTSLTTRSVGVVTDIDALHSSIGFLELLEPHVREWKNKVTQLETRIAEGVDTRYPTIFVEGLSDKVILKAVLDRYHPDFKANIQCASSPAGGHSWVKNSLIAWQYSGGQNKAVGLFDGDQASDASIAEFNDLVENRTKTKRAFKHRLTAEGPALDLAKLHLCVPTAIEEICPKDIWLEAVSQDWLETRPNLNSLYKFSETNITFNDWIESRVTDETLRTIALKRIKIGKKDKFSNYVAAKIKDKNCKYDFQPLTKLADTLLSKIE
jgi:energy-coupling factor transporter ATP-binding protein EcfA2